MKAKLDLEEKARKETERLMNEAVINARLEAKEIMASVCFISSSTFSFLNKLHSLKLN